MKKLMLFMALLGLGAGTIFGQAQQTAPTTPTKPKMEVVKSKSVTKTEVKANKDATVKSSTTDKPVKADGTPDKRYKANKHLKADGTPDKRYKEHKDTQVKK